MITQVSAHTFIIVHVDVFMSRAVAVVVAIPDGYCQCVCARDTWTTFVYHYDGHVVILLFLTIKTLTTGHNS